jgi:D-arginine dehydrogenase
VVSSDFLIVGGGIAGASIGYWLSSYGSVVLLEREEQPGYHSTGRSAALFWEGYGTAQVRALTCASRAFLSSPPDGFSATPILSPRGALIFAPPQRELALQQLLDEISGHAPNARLVSPASALERVPVLRPEKVAAAVFEPDALDIDVHSLHQGYLRGMRANHGRMLMRAEVLSIEREASGWRVDSTSGELRAAVIINASGAWADVLAGLAGIEPLGLVPKRRSAFTFAPPPGLQIADWPMFISVDEDCYVKPDAAALLGSPANADPTHPHDVQAEELDIAIAIDRIQDYSTLTVRRPIRTWAGLRSFVADGDLVGGYEPGASGFFWVAAQGGYGIQTSAAMGEACAALAAGRAIPQHIADFGVNEQMLGPGRLRRAR